MAQEAQAKGKSKVFCETLETVFARFAKVKKAEDFTPDFQDDVMMFAHIMSESEAEEK
jgi:hypothetical protein